MDVENMSKIKSPKIAKSIVGGVFLLILTYILSQSFFYAEPGYIYHVRTVTGNEAVVTEIGYKFYPFGRYNSWKRAMTVQAASGSIQNAITAEKDPDSASRQLTPTEHHVPGPGGRPRGSDGPFCHPL